MRLLLVLLSPIFLLISSCGDLNVDVAAPFMLIVELDPTPEQVEVCGSMEDSVFVLRGAEQLNFEVRFRDDAGLSQYKIDIHSNFDCHGHGGGAAPGISVPDVENQTVDWTVLDIIDLVGRDQTVIENLDVPENVTAGYYHFQIQVIDESGNDNPFANFYALKVFNPNDEIPPVLEVDLPAESSFSAAKGGTIRFKGSVSDNYSLSQGGNGVLFLTYTDLNTGNTFNTDAVFPFDSTIDKEFVFDFEYTVPTTIPAGNYRFGLWPNDGVNNRGEGVTFEVVVTN